MDMTAPDSAALPAPSPSGTGALSPLERRALLNAAKLAVLDARRSLIRRAERGDPLPAILDDAWPAAQRAVEALVNVFAHVPADRAMTAAAAAAATIIYEMFVMDVDGLAQVRAAAAQAAADRGGEEG